MFSSNHDGCHRTHYKPSRVSEKEFDNIFFQQTFATSYTQCACDDAFYLIVCGVLQTRGLMMTGTVIHRHVMLCNQLVAVYLLTRKTQDCSFKEAFFPQQLQAAKLYSSPLSSSPQENHTESHHRVKGQEPCVVFSRKTKVLGWEEDDRHDEKTSGVVHVLVCMNQQAQSVCVHVSYLASHII